jgi:uncharacterized protein (TIGR00251 family)
MTAPWTNVSGGIVVTVRLTPKGGRDAIDGIAALADGSTVLKARVRAIPSDGEANAALGRVLAKALAVPLRDVEIISGHTARIKRVKISGDTAALTLALEKIAHAR